MESKTVQFFSKPNAQKQKCIFLYCPPVHRVHSKLKGQNSRTSQGLSRT